MSTTFLPLPNSILISTLAILITSASASILTTTEKPEYELSLSSPFSILVIISMILFWLISGGILFVLWRIEKRTTNKKSVSDKNPDMVYYEQGLSRNKVPAVAPGI